MFVHPLVLKALVARGACVVRRAAAPKRAEEALENAAKLEAGEIQWIPRSLKQGRFRVETLSVGSRV